MTWPATLAWGAFGAILPEVVRLYRIVQSDNPVFDFPPKYFPISFIFALFAGILTITFRPEKELKAIWIGASFPVIVSTVFSQAPSIPG